MTDVTVPIVIDLGKVRRKRVKDLKRGRGRLMGDVHQALNQVRETMGDSIEGKELVPIVLIYRRRRKRRRRGLGLGLPFLG
jgi:rRNA processing protein Krr1/Pno1